MVPFFSTRHELRGGGLGEKKEIKKEKEPPRSGVAEPRYRSPARERAKSRQSQFEPAAC